MNNKTLHTVLSYFIALVWLINGLYCKVLHFVPRHQQIVASILNKEHARTITILIGLSEIVMAIWTLSRFKSRLNAIFQIIIIVAMNILEFILVPDLLLWGKFNLVFALLFIAMIYYNAFILNTNLKHTK